MPCGVGSITDGTYEVDVYVFKIEDPSIFELQKGSFITIFGDVLFTSRNVIRQYYISNNKCFLFQFKIPLYFRECGRNRLL